LSKKKKTFWKTKVNPPKPNFVPSNVSQHVLGQQGVVAVEKTVTTHQGPIPSPEVIAGYEKVLAGSADRIIKMAEKEQEHRHKLQLKNQTQVGWLTFIGQLFAFVIGVSGVAGGIFLVKNDKSVTGFSVFFTSLAALVGIFLYNRKRSKSPQDTSGSGS
jgi:uncharacterized membrane protein